jgi:carbonic anhydrase
MEIQILLISCMIVMMSQQILDYTDKESGWNCVGNQQSPIDFPLDPSQYIIGRNKLRLISATYPSISGNQLQINNQRNFGFKFDNPIGELKALFNNKSPVVYHLTEINFKLNAEHTFDGLRYDAEIQFVHIKDTDWLTEQGIDDPTPDRSSLIVAVPLQQNKNIPDNKILDSLNIYQNNPVTNLDITPFITILNDYYYYEGSFTTPVCSEEVNWIVMKNPQIISSRQIFALSNWVNSVYPNGRVYRKTQDLNGRTLYYVRRNGLRDLI